MNKFPKIVKPNFAQDAFFAPGGCQGSGFRNGRNLRRIKDSLNMVWRVFFWTGVTLESLFSPKPVFPSNYAACK